jgi:hypothetical protein
MLEKEINPLKRGRIQNLSREQKKKSTFGEISDPFTVLNDSIAVKNQSRSGVHINHVSSERDGSEKTTTVDAIASPPDRDNLSAEETGTIRPSCSVNRQKILRSNNRRNEGHSYGGNRAPGGENYPQDNDSEEREECATGCTKSTCGIKCLWNKILSFLGFGPRHDKNCSCNKSCDGKDKGNRSRAVSRHSNSRGGRNHPRPPQNNRFK